MRHRLKYVASLIVLSVPAHADTEACARTLDEAERLHAAGRLVEAVHEMDACTACDALADVCDSTRSAMKAALPSLRVTVHDCEGRPLPNAKLFVDGMPAQQDDALELDPGAHDVRAELAGGREEQTILVAEHEHRRASLVLVRPLTKRVPASAIAFGVTSLLSLSVSGGLLGAWEATTTTYTREPVLPVAHGTNIPWQRANDELLLAAGVTLSVAVTSLVVALVIYATRPTR